MTYGPSTYVFNKVVFPFYLSGSLVLQSILLHLQVPFPLESIKSLNPPIRHTQVYF